MLSALFFAALPLLAHASALLPAKPIRGVNLGGWFVVEPWMMVSSLFSTLASIKGSRSMLLM
jgi:hypothetical protein